MTISFVIYFTRSRVRGLKRRESTLRVETIDFVVNYRPLETQSRWIVEDEGS